MALRITVAPLLLRVMILVIVAAFSSVVLPAQHVAANPHNSPAWKRVEHLQHGVNAGEWFAQSQDYSPQRLRSFTTKADIGLIRRMGFDHVRLSIDPAIFDCPGEFSQCERVRVLDEIIVEAVSQDLAVVLDLHPSNDYKQKLMSSETAVVQCRTLWGRIAGYYAKSDPERVFFEVLNEPEFTDNYRWIGVEQSLVAEVRRNAPLHSIIVAGAGYSNIDDLVRLTEFADTNLIFNFHFYEPHIFTHQGATWGVPFWVTLRQVPFPPANDALAGAAAAQSDDFARWKLTEYGLDHWDAQHIEGAIAFAADWAKRRNVPLICNEFGVYRKYAKPEDRDRWLETTRKALEANHIGWTMWDYQGGFGVVIKDTGKTIEDRGVLRALGLGKG